MEHFQEFIQQQISQSKLDHEESLSTLPASIRKCIDSDEQLEGKITSACQVFEQAFSQFEPERIALSFNGGKDCTVVLYLLHLWCSFLDTTHQTSGTFQRLQFIHFVKDNEFDEISVFRDLVQEK